MVGPCGLEPQTSTVSKIAQDIIHCGLECGLEIFTEVAPIHIFFTTKNLFALSICINHRQVFGHKRTTQPNVPFAQCTDLTSSPVQQSQELGPGEGTWLLRFDASKTCAFFIKLIVSETIYRATIPIYAPLPEHSANIRTTNLIRTCRSWC
jgi:hypothetical protein